MDESGLVCPEFEVLSRLREGDTRAYDDLYCRYREMLANVVRRELPYIHEQDRQDIVEEVFLTTYAAICSGKGPRENFRGYLVTSARNECKRRRNFLKTEVYCGDSNSLAELQQISGHQVNQSRDTNYFLGLIEGNVSDTPMRIALQSLTPEETTLLWKHVVEGVPYSQLSKEYGISVSRLYNRFDLIKKRLRFRYQMENDRQQEIELQEFIQYPPKKTH